MYITPKTTIEDVELALQINAISPGQIGGGADPGSQAGGGFSPTRVIYC